VFRTPSRPLIDARARARENFVLRERCSRRGADWDCGRDAPPSGIKCITFVYDEVHGACTFRCLYYPRSYSTFTTSFLTQPSHRETETPHARTFERRSTSDGEHERARCTILHHTRRVPRYSSIFVPLPSLRSSIATVRKRRWSLLAAGRSTTRSRRG